DPTGDTKDEVENEHAHEAGRAVNGGEGRELEEQGRHDQEEGADVGEDQDAAIGEKLTQAPFFPRGPHPTLTERLKRSHGTKAPLAWADGPGKRGGGGMGSGRR